MAVEKNERIRAALAGAYACIASMHTTYPDAGAAEVLLQIVAALSPMIPATHQHDAGAYARCSYCGRYTVNPMALGNYGLRCDCGRTEGWSGSFERPGDGATWSITSDYVTGVRRG